MEHGLVTEVEMPSGRKVAYDYVEALKRPGEPRHVLAFPDVAKVSMIPGLGELVASSPGCEVDPDWNGSGTEITTRYSNYHARTHQPLYLFSGYQWHASVSELRVARVSPRIGPRSRQLGVAV